MGGSAHYCQDRRIGDTGAQSTVSAVRQFPRKAPEDWRSPRRFARFEGVSLGCLVVRWRLGLGASAAAGVRQNSSDSVFFWGFCKIVSGNLAIGWIDDFPALLPGRDHAGRATGGGAKLAPGSFPGPLRGQIKEWKEFCRTPRRGGGGAFGLFWAGGVLFKNL